MKQYSSIASSSLGNILEWYDFGLFSIFSSLFSRLFFPTEDPHVALIATFSIFAVGFFSRPLGALLFGYMGDKTGRAKTLRLSILMITLPTLLISFIPTYQHIGIFAPILLTLIRIWQGISIGGEYSGNIIYLAETAPDKHRAIFTSFADMGANLGILLAALVGIITSRFFSNDILEAWGWRIPYLISGLLCLIIYIFRLRIDETIVFDYLKNKNMLVSNPIKTAFKHNMRQILRTLGLVCMGSTFYYFCFIYLPVYIKTNLQYSFYNVSLLISLFIGFMIILVPIAGFICDKVGRRKMFLFNSLLITLTIVPGFYILQVNYYPILIFVLFIFTLGSACEQGTTPITLVENFPPPARYTGLSLGYNVGNGFLGGTVPLVCEWLKSTTSLSIAPALYIACWAILSGLVVFFFVPETKNKSLI
jgi:MHS family proline/betaine transporter-like MFS transporter